jgi:3-isopropylmalate/(R)-2-methylmalate dehydratase large subunit
MTLTEEILARVVGRDSVRAGEYLTVEPDLLIVHEFFIYPQTMRAMEKLGVTRIRHPERVMVVFDHATPATSKAWAEKLEQGRRFVREQGIERFYDVGHGISHQIAAEYGWIRPGMFVTNGDPHVTSYGAFGCFAPAIGTQTQLELLLTGDTWMQVPETLYVWVDGDLPTGATARDVFMQTMHEIGLDGALGMALEFSGPTIDAMDMDQRMSITSLAPLAGATSAVIAADETTRTYLRGRVDVETALRSTAAAPSDARTVRIDVSKLEPRVNLPPDPVTSIPVGDLDPVRIDQAFIGSCAGGRLDEFRAAAEFLRGRSVAPSTRLIVTPASREIYRDLAREGLLDVFLDAGAVIESPGCGACMGFKAALGDGEVCLANSTQNMHGRMGSSDARIYLANAAVVAASAVAGRLTDPRPVASEAAVR